MFAIGFVLFIATTLYSWYILILTKFDKLNFISVSISTLFMLLFFLVLVRLSCAEALIS
jgi:hypothetical protein